MNKYIDIHTHILPNTAFGPNTVEESQAMLAALAEHGVKTAVATPFFDAAAETPDTFLERRDRAYALLSSAPGGAGLPNVVCGAVVSLCPEVLQCRRLDRLRIADTDYVLVKIPVGATIDEALLSLFDHFRIASRLTPVLCGVDALFRTAGVEDMFALQDAGALLQISCAGILDHETRKLSLYLLGNHIAQFVSSGYRAGDLSPQITEAMRVLKRSLPLEKYKRIKNNAGMLLSGAERSALIGG